MQQLCGTSKHPVPKRMHDCGPATFKLVVNTNETIRYMVNKHEITYTTDMFRVTLKLPVETPNHPFTAPTTMKFIQPILKIVSYQGLVDKVSAFYTKNLVQPWQKMFTIFNHCLTSRTSGIDQTKINILHIFHAVINRVHRLEEDYHSIKDDILLVSVYAIGNVIVKGMLILDDLPTNDIYETKEYKDYVKEFFRVDVPTIQPQLIESTQGENRTPRATMTPNPKDVQKKPSSTAIPPPSDDKERDDIAEATLLSLALHKTDSGTRLEPVSHKENPKTVNDDDDDDDDVDDKKDDDDNDDDDNDDHDDHALIASKDTNDLIDDNLPRVVVDVVIKERDALQANVPALISKEVFNHAPKINEELFKTHMKNNFITVHHITSTSTATTTSADLQYQLYLKMKMNLQDQVDDLKLWDVLKRKFEKSSASSGPYRTMITHCTEITMYLNRKMLLMKGRKSKKKKDIKGSKSISDIVIDEEFQNVDKHVLTIYDHEKIEATLRDMMSNQFRDAEVYAYHLEQSKNYMENQIVWESRQEDIRRSKPYAHVFYGSQRNPNKPPRNKFLNSLMAFIRSRVILERVHDFQLGIESYQIKINLTAPTLIFAGIKDCDPYSIIDKPTTGLIYLNNKKGKRVMNLVEIVKFCDATLERVLKELKIKIFETEYLKKTPLLGELDLDIMKVYEREITKRLRHHE
ncbi:hypothetical protein Tco_0005589 [Tanacetum coccineum]